MAGARATCSTSPSPKTIRYYEDTGLIRKADRQANGYRAYSDLHMRELRFIKRARSLGFSIEEVRALVDLWRDKRRMSAAVKLLAAQHLDALDRRIVDLQSMRRSLAHLVEHCRGDERPECPILDELGQAGNPGRRVRVSPVWKVSG